MRRRTCRTKTGIHLAGLIIALLGTGIVIHLVPVAAWYGILACLVFLFLLLLFLTR